MRLVGKMKALHFKAGLEEVMGSIRVHLQIISLATAQVIIIIISS